MFEARVTFIRLLSLLSDPALRRGVRCLALALVSALLLCQVAVPVLELTAIF